ncbi:dipeptidyl peptidase IV/CD26, N-terminal domain-containing protein [Suhomyces tanzawaensis NRRL Y-17324]|uniref:Dipeptidyl peptidase IV/CD26, N-terminal domain-containing protein n=1 Tax=Suhomyces tanzawaensis NRRL Y-17324 TaxID=984487 RepID=A0A1E4SKR3_9ASCO|nr:dipeptidyl peptidase IV/CD26, N-terminal domain-containing protein [Suhomyces tanzawaensis NRRL Y-17324]ODV80080.1 dipeptidyl peptidase IV/CD26, N-terminal domain-containing protein [Suhomyces tanzawaensis NRRL Y-17324]
MPLPVEEYEMVDQLPVELEAGPSIHSPRNSRNSTSSTSSTSSVLFDEIHEYSSKAGHEDESFNYSPLFQRVLHSYQGPSRLGKYWCTIIGLACIGLWVVGLVVYAHESPLKIISELNKHPTIAVSGKNVTLNEYSAKFTNISLTDYRKGRYFSFREPITWLNPEQQQSSASEDTDGGHYLTRGPKGSFVVRQIDTDYTKDFISSTQFAYKNNFFYVEGVQLNPNQPWDLPRTPHIVKTDSLKQWRHLSFAIYWIYRDGFFSPIQPPENLEKLKNPDNPLDAEVLDKLHFAEFSPNGDYIVFGFNHDLYLQNLESGHVDRITSNGSKHIFNGKPDWVYEEEVVSDYKLFWWSPDQANLVYVTLNDTDVQEYQLDYYVKDRVEVGTQYDESEQLKVDNVNQYPIKTTIKYPKPGTANPTATINNYKVSEKKSTKLEIIHPTRDLGHDFIFYSGSWIDSKNFLMKHADRTSKILKKMVYRPHDSNQIHVVNVQDTADYNGWVDKMTPVTVVPGKDGENKYIDKIVANGKLSLALFDSANSQNYSVLLTRPSEWEVVSSSPAVFDQENNFVYTLCTIRGALETSLIGIDLDSEKRAKLIQITDIDSEGVYDVEFSRNGHYLNLNYAGPLQPWQKLVNMNHLHGYAQDDEPSNYIARQPYINRYEAFQEKLKDTNIPTRVYREITIGKNLDNTPLKVGVIEILPPRFDPKRGKYPLLVNAYGGPGSQVVDKSFKIELEDIVSAKLDTIVLIIDPRGTGGRGWDYQAAAKGRIGYWEPRDITTVVSEYIAVNKNLIDEEKTAIWGWSYGGFTTLKVLEYDSGNTFKYGMAVAPVTNWLFYDSIYTERYMGLPAENKNYETTARISQYENFKKLKRFLIMHGTSDDNVHLQNLLWLLDKYNLNNVENYDVTFFPDSDHLIDFHNANSVVYDRLMYWLGGAFGGRYQ